MEENQKGSLLIVFLLLTAVVAAGGLIYYILAGSSSSQDVNNIITTEDPSANDKILTEEEKEEAVEQLQAERRDTQRRNDAGRYVAAMENYASNNNGSYPGTSSVESDLLDYFDEKPQDPLLNKPYEFVMENPGLGQIDYTVGSTCLEDGSIQAYDVSKGNPTRYFAVQIGLEGEDQFYCQDNT